MAHVLFEGFYRIGLMSGLLPTDSLVIPAVSSLRGLSAAAGGHQCRR
jgi:hypothetical protein